MSSLLWGDVIVVQTADLLAKFQAIYPKPITFIPPWPSPKRVQYDETRRLEVRKTLLGKYRRLIVFPGEFQRMGIDEGFEVCLENFFRLSADSKVVLACRFDETGIGNKLSMRFPGRVASVGLTNDIIKIIEAADLVVFPSKKMRGKFNPPMVIMEALHLNRKVMVSDCIGVEEELSNSLRYIRQT